MTSLRSDKVVQIGAWNWLAPSWLERFYPQDLPASQRLPYYASQYRCVLLSGEIWLNGEMPDVEDWLETVDSHFRFFQHLTPALWHNERWPQVLEGLADLEEQLGGVLVDVDGIQARDTVQWILARYLQQQSIFIIDDNDVSTGNEVWTPEDKRRFCPSVGILSLHAGISSLQIKATIERFARCAEGGERYLLVDASPRLTAEAKALARTLL